MEPLHEQKRREITKSNMARTHARIATETLE